MNFINAYFMWIVLQLSLDVMDSGIITFLEISALSFSKRTVIRREHWRNQLLNFLYFLFFFFYFLFLFFFFILLEFLFGKLSLLNFFFLLVIFIIITLFFFLFSLSIESSFFRRFLRFNFFLFCFTCFRLDNELLDHLFMICNIEFDNLLEFLFSERWFLWKYSK